MKIVLCADIHVGVQGKLDDIMWSLNQIKKYCTQNDINKIICLGDLMHDRESINIKDLNMISKFLDDLNSCKIEFITFPGNHDMYMKNSWEINSLLPLSKHLTYIDSITSLEFGSTKFWILPFIHSESDYMIEVEKISEQATEDDILLTHIGIKTAILNTCFLLKSWNLVDFTNSIFKHVYTGHYHTYQTINNKATYIGSPIPFKFDEGDVDHGFVVFDTETKTHEFVSIWFDGKQKSSAPQFYTIDDDMIAKISKQHIEDNIIRIGLKKEYTNNQLEKLRAVLIKYGAKEVRWMSYKSTEHQESINKSKKKVDNIVDIFNQFIKHDKVDNLNHELLNKLNNDIIKESDDKYEFQGDVN